MASSVVESLQVFNTAFNQRAVTLTALTDGDGVLWFRGTDAATALGYKDPARAVRTHVKKTSHKQTLQNLRGGAAPSLLKRSEGSCVYISEAGLYRLICSSELKEAELFLD